jgi:uncharacterized membrane protein
MSKGRLEAFSDGVMAIIITIMVLELKIPKGESIYDLFPLIPVFVCYLLSFVFLGIYWNNHHHLLQAVKNVNGKILWANMHLLFWLTLIPFTTAWMGENNFAPVPTAFYGAVLFFAAIAYYILARTLVSAHGSDSLLASALGNDFKGKISLVIYLIAIPVSFLSTAAAGLLYGTVAVIWLIPDKRIEQAIMN